MYSNESKVKRGELGSVPDVVTIDTSRMDALNYDKQRYQCKDYKRQYVEGSEYWYISPETWKNGLPLASPTSIAS